MLVLSSVWFSPRTSITSISAFTQRAPFLLGKGSVSGFYWKTSLEGVLLQQLMFLSLSICCDDSWKSRLFLEDRNLFFGSLLMTLSIYKTCRLLEWGKHAELWLVVYIVCYSYGLLGLYFASRGKEQWIPTEAPNPYPWSGPQCRWVQSVLQQYKETSSSISCI